MLLMIDNYDSFTYNLVHYCQELGQDVEVYRNDKISLEQINKLSPDNIIISPGPCTPKESGISVDLIKEFAGKIPILGVCLGHQAIGYAFGTPVIRAGQIMHGKTSQIYHTNSKLFAGMHNGFNATRYHSLVLDKNQLSTDFTLDAWTQNADGSIEEIMAISHKTLPLYGVQFHPESILSEYGHDLLKNFLN